MLSWDGIKEKKSYLAIMYGSTIGINLVLFLFIFPLLANFSIAGGVVYSGNGRDLSTLIIEVDIPCPGHAPLISNDLKTIEGVYDVTFSFPNNFEVKYGSKTNEQKILSLDVFDYYPATLISNNVGSSSLIERSANTAPTSGVGCGGGCGGTSCGAGGGSCGGAGTCGA